MAEFQDVMRQLNRMCSHYPNCGDNSCPLFYECGNIGGYSSKAKQAMRIEKIVMSWAAEHSEPVYPTYGEWLCRIGVIRPEIDRHELVEDRIYSVAIPADIAQKLGIEPKEG